MTTWSGWQIQFFAAAKILNTPPNQRFLTAWASHATSPGCHNNPIDLSVSVTGSSRCHRNTGIHPYTFNYDTHGHAAHAFSLEVHEAWARALLSALNSGNPFQVANWNDVVSVLVSWGSVEFSKWYFDQMQSSSGGGGGGTGGGGSGSAHGGWKHLRRVVNQHMPKALRTSERNTAAALRSISRSHKVRL